MHPNTSGISPKLQPMEGAAVAMTLDQVVRHLLRGEDTGGTHSLQHITVPPGSATPPHIHHHEDETFHILSGELEVVVDGTPHRVGPGATVFAPRGIRHFFRNAGSCDVAMLVMITPAGFEKFFDEMDALAKEGGLDPERIVKLGARYALTFG